MYSSFFPFRASTVRAVLVLLMILTATVTVHVEAACDQGYVASGSTCVPDTNNPLAYFVVRVDQDLSSLSTIFGGFDSSPTQTLFQICPSLGSGTVRLFYPVHQSYLFSRVAWYPEIKASSRHVLVGSQTRGNWDWVTVDSNFVRWSDPTAYGEYYNLQILADGMLTDSPRVFTPRYTDHFLNFDPVRPVGSNYSYPTTYYTREPNAVKNLTPPAEDIPARLTVDVVSGYWHNSGLLYSPVYIMCEQVDIYANTTITRTSLRSGVRIEYGGNWDTECARQASDGKQRAARLTTLPKELGFRTAVSQNTAVPLLPAGSFVGAGTAQARWEWLDDKFHSTAAGAAFTTSFAFPDTRLINRVFSFWAPEYPKSDAGPTATRLTYDATAGGWVNIALPATFEIACEPTTANPNVAGYYAVAPRAGWKQTTETMALMCYSDGVMGRLAQPTTAAHEAGLEYVLAKYSNANANTVGVFGRLYVNDAWSWAGSPQYYPDGVTPLASSGVYTNWASGYPLANVTNDAVAGFSAAAGGWVHVDTASATNWVAICEPLPTDEPVDAMENIYVPSAPVPTVPLSGASAVMQACSANVDPVVMITSLATERALKRRLLLDSLDMSLSTAVVGGYFTDPALRSGDWVWINAWDDGKPTTFANHYALSSAPPASTVEGMYTNWAAGYPSSTEVGAGRFVALNPALDGWTNTNGATAPVYVACQTYTMTLTEAKGSVFIVAGATNAAAPNVYRGHLDNLCPAYNGTLYEPNSILKQRALNMVAADAGRTNDALYVGGEYSGTGQSDGTWSWASSGAFMRGFSATVSTGAAVTLADRYINWQSGYPTGTLPTNGQPGNRFASSQKGMWVNAGGATLIYAACAPGPSPYNYGIKIVTNPGTTVSPTAMCGEGYSPLIVSNASVQAALERCVYAAGVGRGNSALLSVRYNVTTGRYVWLVDLRDPATAVSSYVAGDTSDGSYQNWSPTSGLPKNSSTAQFVSNRMKEGGWIQADFYTWPTFMACAPYTAPSDAQTSTLFLVKAPTGIAAPQTYAGSLTNLCRAYNGALFEPSSAFRQDALEQAVNAKITAGMPSTTDVYIGARYYGDSATGGVWAFESSNGAASGVFTTNFGSGAIVAVNRYTGWAANNPAGSLTTDGSPGPRFAAFRRDLNGWVNPATESTDFYAACYTTTPPETFDITVVAHSGSAVDSDSLCGAGRAPLIVLNANAQAALERKLILDDIPRSATVLLGGLYDTGNSAWTWVRDMRDILTAMSVFGSTNTSAYTAWALAYPASPAAQRHLGFSAGTGGWVNVASVADAAYVACEPRVPAADEEASRVFLVESRSGVAAPQTYAGSVEHLCPAFNGTLYELSLVRQEALERVMAARGVPSGANVYVGGRYVGDTTQDGAWTWTSGGAFTSKYGLDSNASLTAVPSPTAFTSWAAANPAMHVTTNGTPSARYVAMNSDAGGWVNPATETTATTTFYAACVAAPPLKDYGITIAPRSGASLDPEALCGSGRAPLIVLNADVQAALERKLIEARTDATSTVLLGGFYNAATTSWTWLRDLGNASSTVSLFGSGNTSAYGHWAPKYPVSSATQRHHGFSASAGGWVNVASVTDAAYVACEPYDNGRDGITPTGEPKKKGFLWWPILVAILGAALIAVLIIVLCCCCRRRKPTELHANEYVDTVTPPRVRPPLDADDADTEKVKTVEMTEVPDESDVRVFSARPSIVSGTLNPLALPVDDIPEVQPRGPRRRNRARRANGLDVVDVDLDFMADANTNINDDISGALNRRE